jgi:hypothetical protein
METLANLLLTKALVCLPGLVLAAASILVKQLAAPDTARHVGIGVTS